MKYLGNKERIVKEIIPLILKNATESTTFVEPFCGSCSVIKNVHLKNKIANDYHPLLIACLKGLQLGWKPPELITEKDYYEITSNDSDAPDYLKGYVGFNLSFGSKLNGGYRRDKSGVEKDSIEFCNNEMIQSRQAYNSCMKLSKLLDNIEFHCGSYDELIIPKNSIIYCDPPYKNTTGYKGTPKFDHDKFYDWCRLMKSNGNDIFISEYSIPDDFIPIWSTNLNSKLKNKEIIAIEKLYTL